MGGSHYRCMICKKAVTVDQAHSKIRLYAPKNRVYVLRCPGRSLEHPHPPSGARVDVLSTYADGDWKMVRVTLQVIDPGFDVYSRFRAHRMQRARPPKLDGRNNQVMNYKDMNSADPKCLRCGRKLVRNDKATADRKEAGVVVFECEGETADGQRQLHRPITYIVQKHIILLRENKRGGEPVPVNWDELLEWREWILESPDFATALYEGGMLRVVDGAKEKKEK